MKKVRSSNASCLLRLLRKIFPSAVSTPAVTQLPDVCVTCAPSLKILAQQFITPEITQCSNWKSWFSKSQIMSFSSPFPIFNLCKAWLKHTEVQTFKIPPCPARTHRDARPLHHGGIASESMRSSRTCDFEHPSWGREATTHDHASYSCSFLQRHYAQIKAKTYIHIPSAKAE